MPTCARRCCGGGGGGVPPRPLVLLVPPLLLALRLLASASRGPGAPRPGAPEPGAREAAVAFSVISIEPERAARRRGGPARRRGGPATEAAARAYEDENEMPASKAFTVIPWAADAPSFSAELARIVKYVSRPQLNCSRVLFPGQARVSPPPPRPPRWLLCAEDWLLPAGDGPCVAYSFSMDGGDADFLRTVSSLGCEVHRFDPGGRPGNASAGRGGGGSRGGAVSRHRMWLEWRRRRRGGVAAGGGAPRTLADITAALGHRAVDFLYADLLSAEWRVFQNWIESGTLQRVHHLVATVHLEWAGFEVGGTDEEVLRYWFSVLQGLRAGGLELVHGAAAGGRRVLRRPAAGARSSYTLSWVNTRR